MQCSRPRFDPWVGKTVFSYLYSFPLYECLMICFSLYHWWTFKLLSGTYLHYFPSDHLSFPVPVNCLWLAKDLSSWAPQICISSLLEGLLWHWGNLHSYVQTQSRNGGKYLPLEQLSNRGEWKLVENAPSYLSEE